MKASASDKDDIERELRQLLLSEMREMYWMEKCVTELLLKIQSRVLSVNLRTLIERHQQQVGEHIVYLEQAFQMLSEPPQETVNRVSAELINEANITVDDKVEQSLLCDLELILLYQQILGYMIISCGGLVQIAHSLNFQAPKLVFEKLLSEKRATNDKLVAISKII